MTAFSRPQIRLSWASPWPGELGAGAGASAGRGGRAVGRGVALGVGVGVKTRGGEGGGGGLNVGCSSKSCICHIGRWNGGINCGRCCGLKPNNGNVVERSECDQESITLVGGSAKAVRYEAQQKDNDEESPLTWRGTAQDVAVQHEERQLGYHSRCGKVHAILDRATIAQILLVGFLVVPQ